jgi:hypothetical protein
MSKKGLFFIPSPIVEFSDKIKPGFEAVFDFHDYLSVGTF